MENDLRNGAINASGDRWVSNEPADRRIFRFFGWVALVLLFRLVWWMLESGGIVPGPTGLPRAPRYSW